MAKLETFRLLPYSRRKYMGPVAVKLSNNSTADDGWQSRCTATNVFAGKFTLEREGQKPARFLLMPWKIEI